MEQAEPKYAPAFRPGAKVAVIGAGPAGITAARRLLGAGLDVTVFERKSQPGGTWVFQKDKPQKVVVPTLSCANHAVANQDSFDDDDAMAAVLANHAPASACYESLTNNIATPLMQFDGFEYPSGTDWFVSHRDILQYLRKFAQDTGVDAVTKYNTSVATIKKQADGKWNIRTHRLELDGQGKLKSTFEENIFDMVTVSTGHYDRAFVPVITGLDTWIAKWPGAISHSKGYRNNKGYEDKTVLIIGAGSSAFDIGREVAYVAHTVYQSVRQQGSDRRPAAETIFERTTRSVLPENVVKITSIVSFESDTGSNRINDAHVRLQDGRVLTGIDHIIFCTGYRFSLPFLDAYSASNVDELSSCGLPPVITNGVQLQNLHEDIFYIPDPTLAFTGVKFEVSTCPFFDVQATFLASVFSGRTGLPSKDIMADSYKRRLAELGPGKPFHVLGWKKERIYMKAVAECIKEEWVYQLVENYDRRLADTRARQLEAFRGFLTRTTKFRGRTREEIAELIESKMRGIEIELAGTAGGVQADMLVV